MVTALSSCDNLYLRFRCPTSAAGVYVLSTGQYVPTDVLGVSTVKQQSTDVVPQVRPWYDSFLHSRRLYCGTHVKSREGKYGACRNVVGWADFK